MLACLHSCVIVVWLAGWSPFTREREPDTGGPVKLAGDIRGRPTPDKQALTRNRERATGRATVERMTSRLSVQSDVLLQVLRNASGDWLTRSSIARRLRKRRLSAYDIAMLEILQEKGLVEIQHRENRTPIGYEFVYSATERNVSDERAGSGQGGG